MLSHIPSIPTSTKAKNTNRKSTGSLCENVTALSAAAEGSLGLHWVSQDSLMEFDWSDAPDNFLKKLKPIHLFFLSIYCFHLGWCSQQACRERPDLETAWCWLFFQAGVTIEAGTSWKLGPTTHSSCCWGSLSVGNWEWERRNNGYQYSLGFYV